ncbi:DUF4199 family protein [Flavobacteriaceae bacterium R38]|nr:DUF4199 family protein [Flavobacteriaceae bacterium R38]
MESKKRILRKTIFKFGLILTAMCLVSFIFSYLEKEHLNLPPFKKAMRFIVIAIPVVFGIRAFKKDNEGFTSFKEALKAGFGISALAGVLMTISYYLFLTVIEPDTIQQIIELYQAQSIDISFIKPWLLSLVIGFQIIFTGMIFTLISGLLLKKSLPATV